MGSVEREKRKIGPLKWQRWGSWRICPMDDREPRATSRRQLVFLVGEMSYQPHPKGGKREVM